ncbi:MAG: DUF3391 domain-containing protein, partial [Rhodoferax sp.]|nr:DUF3391 domain-containing protein [Rhodoferax sp.]
MDEIRSELIDVEHLQPGMYVELELGWMAHPFPTGSFKITSDKQIEIIRGLGRKQVRYLPGKSDQITPIPPMNPANAANANPASADAQLQRQEDAAREQQRQQRAEQLAAQQRDLALCERRFGQTVRQYKQVLEQVYSQPQAVLAQCQALITDYVTEMLGTGESAIRLLSDGSGDKLALHPVNITIISLLLGKQLGLSAADMTDLGL